MKINKDWHLKNKMPPKATMDQRITWHTEHIKNCSCRGLPESIKKELAKRGVEVFTENR
ncbi:MAG: hypothetical protein MJB14_21275 [Spirochaetes bacterium]|nr:hypothetical protein [Spirochaetota bacterium]